MFPILWAGFQLQDMSPEMTSSAPRRSRAHDSHCDFRIRHSEHSESEERIWKNGLRNKIYTDHENSIIFSEKFNPKTLKYRVRGGTGIRHLPYI